MFGDIFDLSSEMQQLDSALMAQCRAQFDAIEEIRDHNQLKVLGAFTKNRVGAQHLVGTTGYGYGDIGRDTLDRVFADAVGAQDALCRAHFMSGTHAITVALFGVLRVGDTMLSVTGAPYDTLESVVGTSSGAFGSIREFGIDYRQIDLKGGRPDLGEIARCAPGARVIYIQRSRGYSNRRTLSCADIEAIARAAKSTNPAAIVMVDNCYGEFCEPSEPTQHGADLMAGSLIKNPGGGIAETGGYIAGRADLVELCGHRLTAPGAGREVGCTPGGLRNLYLGLYLAPSITAEALKSMVYASALFEQMGYAVAPHYTEPRSDIITAIELGSEKALLAFCRAIQAHSPVDSFATPEAWDMPGYDSKVIMASGAFTCGSSIELSCDAPVQPPFTVYVQGGISLAASRYALLKAAQELKYLR